MNHKLQSNNDFRRAEQFLHSLILSKAQPHYVVAKKDQPVFTLERMHALLSRLGNPHHHSSYVHITGTSGKSSTAHLTAALLQAHGLRTGLHISPHLENLCERLTINGEPCSKSSLVAQLQAVKPILNTFLEDTDFGPPSYFELVLALAFQHFQAQETDLVVLEVGLGGRYDGTNVIPNSLASVITTIGLDHTNVLGDTKEAIAQDKIGILRPNGRLLTAEQDPAIVQLFQQQCLEMNATLERLGQDFHCDIAETTAAGSLFDYRSPDSSLDKLFLAWPGNFQARNAALALRATEYALENRKIDPQACRQAFQNIQIPGRLEIISQDPLIVLDGAHNPQKIENLCSAMKALFPGEQFTVIHGATTGRDMAAILRSLDRIAHNFLFTSPMAEFRANEDPKGLALELKKTGSQSPSKLFLDPLDALTHAKEQPQKILITGSLYLISYLRPFLVSKDVS